MPKERLNLAVLCCGRCNARPPGIGDKLAVYPVDDRPDALANADAHRREAITSSAPPQLVDKRRQDPRTRAAERVAERDRAAVDVDASAVEVLLTDALQRLGAERLIQLDEVHVADPQP